MNTPATSTPSAQPDPQPGRPPVLGPIQRRKIVTLLSAGCSRRVAARRVGCAPSTIARTAARDPDFAEELAEAESSLETEMLDSIRHAAKTDRYWRAAGWLLERKNPQDFAPRSADLYTPNEMIELFTAALDTLQHRIPRDQRDLAVQDLQSLLLELDPPTPRPKIPQPHSTP
jgi:hypothetical protein